MVAAATNAGLFRHERSPLRLDLAGRAAALLDDGEERRPVVLTLVMRTDDARVKGGALGVPEQRQLVT